MATSQFKISGALRNKIQNETVTFSGHLCVANPNNVYNDVYCANITSLY